MKPQTVLVTGGAGFIGRWTVRELLAGGTGPVRFDPPDVVALDNLENGGEDNLAEFRGDPHFVDLVIGDIGNRALIERMFVQHRFDWVLHLAAKINVQESIDAPTGVFEADVIGTFHLLERARQAETAFIFISTCMVYSHSTADSGIDERHPTLPASPYAGAKLAAENMVASYQRAYGMRNMILRPFNTYGPWQKATGEGGVVSIFLHRDLTGQEINIYGDGSQTRDLLYVEDCARFIVQAGFSEAAVGQVINAGAGRDIAINELASLICRDASRIKHVPHIHPQAEINKLLANVSLARQVCNWRPEVTLEQGLMKTREWIRNRIPKK